LHEFRLARVTAAAETETAAGAAVGLATRMASAWLDVTSHAFSVGAQYWQGAIARGASPADVLDDAYTWMRLTQDRPDLGLAEHRAHREPGRAAA
jgi:hypothetical protein